MAIYLFLLTILVIGGAILELLPSLGVDPESLVASFAGLCRRRPLLDAALLVAFIVGFKLLQEFEMEMAEGVIRLRVWLRGAK